MRIIEEESGGVLKLEGTLNISIVEELRKALLDSLSAAPGLTLDLAGVDQCDTAALQVLYSGRKTAEQSGKRLVLQNLSGPVAGIIDALGLEIGDLHVHCGTESEGAGVVL